jgi:hypothetical protein
LVEEQREECRGAGGKGSGEEELFSEDEEKFVVDSCWEIN